MGQQFDVVVPDDGGGFSVVPSAGLDPSAALDRGADAVPPAGPPASMPMPTPMPAMVPPAPAGNIPAGLTPEDLLAALGGAPAVRPPIAIPTAAPPPGHAQKILSAALLGLAAGLGPRHGGTGVSQGLMQGHQANELAARQKLLLDRQEAIRLQAIQDAEQRAAQARFEKRQQDLQQALSTIRTEMKSFPSKAVYDQRIDGYADILRSRVGASSTRVDGPSGYVHVRRRDQGRLGDCGRLHRGDEEHVLARLERLDPAQLRPTGPRNEELRHHPGRNGSAQVKAGMIRVDAEYMALPQLAQYGGLSVRTLRGYLTHAVYPLPCYKIGGRVLVRRSDYDAWAARFRVEPSATIDAMASTMLRGL
jgi:hypothetical protein